MMGTYWTKSIIWGVYYMLVMAQLLNVTFYPGSFMNRKSYYDKLSLKTCASECFIDAISAAL